MMPFLFSMDTTDVGIVLSISMVRAAAQFA